MTERRTRLEEASVLTTDPILGRAAQARETFCEDFNYSCRGGPRPCDIRNPSGRGRHLRRRRDLPLSDLRQMGRRLKKETGIGLNYQSIGSGGGIKQIKAKTVTFGASDMPLKAEDLEEVGPGAVPDGHRRRSCRS